MTRPIAFQLYTGREQLVHDYEGTLCRIAEIGSVGLETARLDQGPSAALRQAQQCRRRR